MKYLLFSMVVTAASAAFVPFSETTGKPIEACSGKNRFDRTYNVPHETDCSKFYKCLGSYGFEIDCPTLKGIQLLFNEELQVCDWEGGSNCQATSAPSGTTGPTSTPTSTPTPTPTPTTTPTSTSTGVPEPNCSVNPERKKPHPDRNKYYQCVNGEPQERTCPEGNYFNWVIAECDLQHA